MYDVCLFSIYYFLFEFIITGMITNIKGFFHRIFQFHQKTAVVFTKITVEQYSMKPAILQVNLQDILQIREICLFFNKEKSKNADLYHRGQHISLNQIFSFLHSQQ